MSEKKTKVSEPANLECLHCHRTDFKDSAGLKRHITRAHTHLNVELPTPVDDLQKKPIIYTSYSGFEVRDFSYSMANDIAECGWRARAKRIYGWTSIKDKAALHFGDCIEEALMWHFDDERRMEMPAAFEFLWKEYKDADLIYTEKDGNWQEMMDMGMRLSDQFVSDFKSGEFTRDTVGFVNPRFGMEFPKPSEPHEWYNGTTLRYKADAVCCPSELAGFVRTLVDVKTSASSYPEKEKNAGIIALDRQLRVGALASGLRNVGFLVFVKSKKPKVQWLTGFITDELLRDIDLWLREQYHKWLNRRFHRSPGIRFPQEQCMACEFFPLCIGRPDLAGGLRQKESKKTGSLNVLD